MADATAPALAVVVPMYNEERGARNCVVAVLGVLESLPGRSALFVVDDGSQDRTVEVLEQALRDGARFQLVRSESNGGYGAALAKGMLAAGEQGFEWALFMDSDLTNPPSDIPTMWRAMSDDVDMVKATRYAAGGDSRSVPWQRRAPSVAGNWFARMVGGMPVTDATNGFRAVRISAVRDFPRTQRGFSAIMEEMLWATRRGLRIVEVPTRLTARTGEQRPSSFSYRPRALWAYAQFPLRRAVDRLTPVARRSTPERQRT